MVGKISEDKVEVHPVSNPFVHHTMSQASKALCESMGNANFDQMCREYETQQIIETKATSGHTDGLTLAAKFVPKAPRISTECAAALLSGPAASSVPTTWGLHNSQVQAVTQNLEHRFSTVVGPLGTGKTRTIVATAMFLPQIVVPEGPGSARVAIMVPTHAAGEAAITQLA
ncbi:hypothetical protein BJY00DRAFT_312829 [Aspergillus carlsbadensis]|nr:hypothetical protein BJY00DRAFT_312829 [Aspergillus carlsbadensis]